MKTSAGREPSTLLLFLLTPVALAIALALFGPLIFAVIDAGVRSASGNTSNPPAIGSIALKTAFFAGIAATAYILTHWPFIPWLDRARRMPPAQQAWLVAGATLYGALAMIAFAVAVGWLRALNAEALYYAGLGAAISAPTTLAILAVARRYAAPRTRDRSRDRQIGWASMAVIFFLTPFIAAALLSPIAAVVYVLVGAIDHSLPDAWGLVEIAKTVAVATGLALLFSGGAALTYVAMHWPFIPVVRWAATKGMSHQALLVAAMILYAVVLTGVLDGWDTRLNQMLALLPCYVTSTLAVVFVTSWRTSRRARGVRHV